MGGGGWGDLFSYLFVVTNFPKIVNYFIFEQVQEKFEPIDKRIIVLFTQKVLSELSEIGLLIRVWESEIGQPRSGIRKNLP
jgi:hypothetical protein